MLETELNINEFVENVTQYLVRYYGYEDNEAYKIVLSSKVLSYVDEMPERIMYKDIENWARLIDYSKDRTKEEVRHLQRKLK